MKIEKIISQHRRDFEAMYVCEHCGHSEEGSGYDDAYFHKEVIPSMSCKKCKLKSGDNYTPKKTKYLEGEVV